MLNYCGLYISVRVDDLTPGFLLSIFGVGILWIIPHHNSLTIMKSINLLRYTEKPQVEQNDMNGVMVDTTVVAIRQVLFWLNYVAPASITECDYRLIPALDIHIM